MKIDPGPLVSSPETGAWLLTKSTLRSERADVRRGRELLSGGCVPEWADGWQKRYGLSPGTFEWG